MKKNEKEIGRKERAANGATKKFPCSGGMSEGIYHVPESVSKQSETGRAKKFCKV